VRVGVKSYKIFKRFQVLPPSPQSPPAGGGEISEALLQGLVILFGCQNINASPSERY